MLESQLAVDPEFSGTAGESCTNDMQCEAVAQQQGRAHTFQYVCIGDTEFAPGTCRRLLEPERIQMTPERIAIVTADDGSGEAYDLASRLASASCTPPDRPAPRAGQIGNPGAPRAAYGPTTTGFSRYIAPPTDTSVSSPFDPAIVLHLWSCNGGHGCFYDTAQPIRAALP